MRQKILNQTGGVYLVTLMVASSLGGSFLFIKKHFDAKLSRVEYEHAREDHKNAKREITEALNDPRICMATLGEDFYVTASSIEEEYRPIEEYPPNDPPAALFRDIALIDSQGDPFNVNQPSPKLVRSKSLKPKDIQLIFPDGIDDTKATQYVKASLFVTLSHVTKGDSDNSFPEIEKPLLLRLAKDGGKHKVVDCAPERPPEMEPINFVTFKVEMRGEKAVYIHGDGRSTFKLCLISGFGFKPDLNAVNSHKYKGDIASRAPWECKLRPEGVAGPSQITHPVPWIMSLNADVDYNFLGMKVSDVESDILCEAICF